MVADFYQESLAKNRERFVQITNNMSDVVCQVDLNWNYKYISPSSKKLMGYEPDELLAGSIYDFIHPDDLLLVKKAMAEAVKTLAGGRIDYRIRHADGYYFWIEAVTAFFIMIRETRQE